MRFKQIGKNRYSLQTDEGRFIGTVEKQEYDSINMATGRRTKRRFWRAFGHSAGWKVISKKMFTTREEAAEDLIKESKKAYAERAMAWTVKV